MCKAKTDRFHSERKEYAFPAGELPELAVAAVLNYCLARVTGLSLSHAYGSTKTPVAEMSEDELGASHNVWDFMYGKGWSPYTQAQVDDLARAEADWEAKATAARASGKEPKETLGAVRKRLLLAFAEKIETNPALWTGRLPQTHEVIQTIGSAWTVKGNGDYVGTFPKRFSKLLFKQFGVKLSSTHVSELGNIASAHIGNETTYTLDFNSAIDWDAGDYGDEGSCYWGCRQGAKLMIRNNGGRAVRSYNRKGNGRAFLAPHDGLLILFNAYGPASLWEYARILATNWGESYKRVRLVNEGTASGELWINNEFGIAIGPVARIAELADNERIDLDWTEEQDGTQCADCEDTIDDGAEYSDPDGNTICESCYDGSYTRCEACDNTFAIDDVQDCGGSSYCERCATRRGFVQCEDCSEWSNSTTDTTNGHTVCESCAENYHCCEDCESLAPETERTTDGREVCRDCRTNYETCEDCDELTKTVETIDGSNYCESCAEDHRPDDDDSDTEAADTEAADTAARNALTAGRDQQRADCLAVLANVF